MHPLEYMEGGVPPLDIFTLDCEALLKAQEDCVLGEEDGEIYTDARPSISLIALQAFTEGFFKSTFAAIGNMCPTALENFASKRPENIIPLGDLLLVKEKVSTRLGSLVAEGLDFGAPKKINGLFRDLIEITPFSAEAAKRFGKLLAIRNQIVHHGGMITARYFRQQHNAELIPDDIHWDSVDITPQYVSEEVDFLKEIASMLTDKALDKMLDLEGAKTIFCHESNKEYDLFDYFQGTYESP